MSQEIYFLANLADKRKRAVRNQEEKMESTVRLRPPRDQSQGSKAEVA